MVISPERWPELPPRYSIVRWVGAGGMGTVYQAMDADLGAPVAVKVLHGSLTAEAAARFDREAEALHLVRHPSVVRYIGYGRTDGGSHYLVMEWLEGTPLDEVLLHSDRLRLRDAITITQRIAGALVAVHRAGLVHRDLKPANIVLVGGEPARARLLDFGVVRSLDGTAVTAVGAVIGTVGYMSPEQIEGTRDIDGRSDLYALGCVLFEMLAGTRPFGHGDRATSLSRPLTEPAPRVQSFRRGVPALLADLTAALLERDPERRPPNADAVLAALTEIAATLGDTSEVLAPLPSVGHEERVRQPAVLARWVPAEVSPTVRPAGGTTLTRDRPGPLSTGDITVVADPASARAPASYVETVTREDASWRATVQIFGGTVVALGGGFTAVLLRAHGTPTDHAWRALRCAIALRDALGATVAAGHVRRDFRDGDDARAGSLAPLADMLDSERDRHVVRLDEVLGPLLWQKVDLRRDADGLYYDPDAAPEGDAPGPLRMALPFVGRDRELALLSGLFAECVEDDRSRAAVVTGPSGIGKTRMLRELCASLADRAGVASVVWAAADDHGGAEAYGVLRRVVEATAKLPTHGDAATRARALRDWLGALLPPAEADRTFDALATIGALDRTTEPRADGVPSRRADARELEAALERVVRASTRSGPLLVVLEDLHWADAASIRLFDATLARVADVPWMVCATGRNELLEKHPRPFGRAGATSVALQGLAPRAAARLVRAALPGAVGDAQADRLVAHASGNAFFLEELIRAVRENRGESIPETVLASLEARLMSLDPEARRVLRAASVLGQHFDAAGLAAVLDRPAEDRDIADWLEELVRADILRREHDGELRFVHALLHDASYAMLTDADRRAAHGEAARFLVDRGARDPARVAHHLALAGRPGEAARHRLVGARRALHMGERDLARQEAERAAAEADDLLVKGEAHLLAGQACQKSGNLPAATAHCRSAMSLLPKSDPRWLEAQTTLVLGGMSATYLRR